MLRVMILMSTRNIHFHAKKTNKQKKKKKKKKKNTYKKKSPPPPQKKKNNKKNNNTKIPLNICYFERSEEFPRDSKTSSN